LQKLQANPDFFDTLKKALISRPHNRHSQSHETFAPGKSTRGLALATNITATASDAKIALPEQYLQAE
jgi:hypothetical protein